MSRIRVTRLHVKEVIFKSLARGGYWNYRCDGCRGQNVPYMLTAHVWKKVKCPGEKFLCLKCVQSRLKRKLTVKDFILMNIYGVPLPINNGLFGFDVRQYCLYNRTVSPRRSMIGIMMSRPCKSLFVQKGVYL